jgi:hypothetical protein
MKAIVKNPMRPVQECLINQFVDRNGVITPKDFSVIAEVCKCTPEYVARIAHGDPMYANVIEEVDRKLSGMPIIAQTRRIAYAQKMLDDQLMRRAEENMPLTNYDPLEILDYIRKEVNSGDSNVDNRNQSINFFDFSAFSDEKLLEVITRLQSALDTGDIDGIVEGEFVELEPTD